jgi:hypothetical protein
VKIPARYAHLVFSFLMSTMMAFIMTAIVTAINTGLAGDFVSRWAHAFLLAWMPAFACVLVLAPPIRKWVNARTVQ